MRAPGTRGRTTASNPGPIIVVTAECIVVVLNFPVRRIACIGRNADSINRTSRPNTLAAFINVLRQNPGSRTSPSASLAAIVRYRSYGRRCHLSSSALSDASLNDQQTGFVVSVFKSYIRTILSVSVSEHQRSQALSSCQLRTGTVHGSIFNGRKCHTHRLCICIYICVKINSSQTRHMNVYVTYAINNNPCPGYGVY